MIENQGDWQRAINKTWIVRFPKQHLATFGNTNIAYYVVTEPIYQDVVPGKREGVVRTGQVVAEKPAVVTPFYAMSLDGFSDEAYEYFDRITRKHGPNAPGILYQYRNEPEGMDFLSGEPDEIAHRISDDLDTRDQRLAVVMVSVDEYWDVALLKFIYEFTSASAAQNVKDLQSSRMLEPQPAMNGIPRAATERIEAMFREVERSAGSPDILKRELDRWGLFDFYEDRFLALFRRGLL